MKKPIKINDKRDYYRNVYLFSDHWKQLRAEKLRLNPVCEKCGYDKRVEPHHLQYKNLFDVTPEDLQTLCRRCHTKIHVKLDQEKIWTCEAKKARREKSRKHRLIKAVKKKGIDPKVAKFYLDKLMSEGKIKFK